MAPTFIDLERDFYHVYGKTLAAWAILESELCIYFRVITQMNYETAHAIFYSARSFQGRADMLAEVIPFAKTPPSGKKALEKIVNLSRSYVSVRNSLAHDIHTARADRLDIPGGLFIRDPATGRALSVDDIYRAQQNYLMLANAMAFSMGEKKIFLEPELSLQLLNLLAPDALGHAEDRTSIDRIVSELVRLVS